ncbi:12250_t:CDS:2 [Ambispora leptoticha]|uniref:12250_t:CDS:1 n=1 Tax=Ambispora leptoticha TaxID=144679 RepID=A0A9N8VQR5_9GLOM|nr:12250_t:CDS:2 [Ambispora leptoticha]
MKILAIGDIFGKTGRQVIRDYLPKLKKEYEIDLVVANVENATHGKGISRRHYHELKSYGIDVMTSGNHIFALEETKRYINEVSDLLRPLNSNPYHPGSGTVLINVKGKKIRVTNLLGTNFMPIYAENPYFVLEKLLKNKDYDLHLVDFHAETTAEKIALLLTDVELQNKFNFYREKIQAAEKRFREKVLDKYLVPVFALVREVIYRKTGLLLFPTQIFGGIVLHYANIAQMNTGEGKTLTAFLPICLNALSGRSVFVITVNEYLSQRDWSLAKPILDFFKLNSGVNSANISSKEKHELYNNCHVVYTTSSELGFDYLRNNLVTDIQQKNKQDFYYAIIDEVDSILIDEAQNPLIISQRSRQGEIIHPSEYQATTHSGIHQAIESKEGIQVTAKSKTIATITYQNFYRLFTKLAGMTGTAATESEEFRQIYGMEVIAVPPYRKLIRKRQPILIGSPSVETSEYLSVLLDKENIPHYKLNAVNHQQEAEIIAQAGQLGAITISTNMAGRGTDIILSEESKKAGGLLVIGVERNTSRRIDNQLRGRAGRQGDPGKSQFYISLEDELIKNFSVKESVGAFFTSQQLKELFSHPLSGKIFNFLIFEPQETLRSVYSANRQYHLNYDLLITRQRQFTYSYRDKLLTASDLTKIVKRKKSQKVEITLQEQEYLKFLLVKELLVRKNQVSSVPQEFTDKEHLVRQAIALIENTLQQNNVSINQLEASNRNYQLLLKEAKSEASLKAIKETIL